MGLLWPLKGRAQTVQRYTAPSWSRASVTWQKAVDIPPTYSADIFDATAITPVAVSPLYSSKATINNIQLAVAGNDPYLKVNSVTLIVCGLTYSFDDLLSASRSNFQQADFGRSGALRGSVEFCELNHYKEGLRKVLDLQSSA